MRGVVIGSDMIVLHVVCGACGVMCGRHEGGVNHLLEAALVPSGGVML